jgi:hypothetical protein
MFKTISLKKQAMVTGSKLNKGGNMNSIRREAGREFRNKKRIYLKDSINELGIRGKKKNIIHIFISPYTVYLYIYMEE